MLDDWKLRPRSWHCGAREISETPRNTTEHVKPSVRSSLSYMPFALQKSKGTAKAPTYPAMTTCAMLLTDAKFLVAEAEAEAEAEPEAVVDAAVALPDEVSEVAVAEDVTEATVLDCAAVPFRTLK